MRHEARPPAIPRDDRAPACSAPRPESSSVLFPSLSRGSGPELPKPGPAPGSGLSAGTPTASSTCPAASPTGSCPSRERRWRTASSSLRSPTAWARSRARAERPFSCATTSSASATPTTSGRSGALKGSGKSSTGVSSMTGGRTGRPASDRSRRSFTSTKRKKTKSEHLSLAGTMTNCSGGATPWGTWLSSEEAFLGPARTCSGPARLHLRGPRLRRPGTRDAAAAQGHGPLRKGRPGLRSADGRRLSDRGQDRRALLSVPAGVAGPARRRRAAPGPGRGGKAGLRYEQLENPDDRDRPGLRNGLGRPRRARPRRERPAAPRPGEGRGRVRQRGRPRPSRRRDPVRLHERRDARQRTDLALRPEPRRRRRRAKRTAQGGSSSMPNPTTSSSSTIRTK